ncbi:4-(cytidine 5'-diphospho)-2-C-methyl-D-erythritol kinase [Anaerovorax odorimutans]|uniref:4-(cytidine 5'-diphospho)-2-C-methyl-D-erythritol kinase n=1 Tax=Anaerovorax odorimutans TaxID=109327 RepID=UPI00041C8C37|nr:4-(cytidine 5'-diphospho)-2-C-methyl-D-erythritol kinase [Anaerovorax odorimutans]
MNSIVLKAYAKINLSIDVLGKRSDGYHEVLMVMQQIDLYDTVKVYYENLEFSDDKNLQNQKNNIIIKLGTNLEYLPTDDKNIAYKAALLMCEKYKRDSGIITIDIDKKIPVAAGLAGGSANGAAVIHALSKLWNLNLNIQDLMDLGKQLGADVPFCIMGQAALNTNLEFLKEEGKIGTCAIASGIGEKLEVINGLAAWVVLSKPPISVVTAKVYKELKLNEITKRPNTNQLVKGLKENNFYKISKNLINVLESVSLKEYPVIVYTKNKFEEIQKGHKALMSGSGPTVFSLYFNKNKAKRIYSKLKEINDETFLVKLL